MYSIAFQSWKSAVFLLRFATMPIRDTFITILSSGYYCNLIANNGGSITIEHNFGGTHTVVNNPWWGNIQLNRWIFFIIQNNGTGLTIYAVYASDSAPAGWMGASVSIENGRAFYLENATWSGTIGQNTQACSIIVGTGFFTGRFTSAYSTSAFYIDVGWVHFFDTEVNKDIMKREANANWIYTKFPTSYDTYSS
jgi:hypothetical protein